MATEYYSGKQFFITGGSGVLGKGIIEKLLRSTDVDKIYVLMRTKRNMTLEERMKDIKNGVIFDRLREEKPHALDKVIAIAGDICEPLLGMSEESFKIIQNVDILIHSAATVRFTEPLRDSIRKNVGGTYECVKVAQKIKNLKLFVHISTYYSNPCESYIKNIIYPPPMDWRQALELCDSSVSDEKIAALVGKYIGNFPNTYTFTKNLAENVVNDHQSLFPILITRPSVLVCARFEPFPGYTEKFQGVTGIIAFLGSGMLHSLYGKPHESIDVVWADLVVNIHLLSIARIGMMKEKLTKPEIVLVCAYPHDNFSFVRRFYYIVGCQKRFPYAKCFGPYNLKVVSCYYHYVLRVMAYQLAPALIFDLVFRAIKMKPIMMALQRRIFLGNIETKHFCFNSFKSDGVTHLAELVLMSKEASEFNIDSLFQQTTDRACENSYDAFVSGNRKYLLKEDDSSLPSARRRYKIIERVHSAMNLIFYIVMTWMFFKFVL